MTALASVPLVAAALMGVAAYATGRLRRRRVVISGLAVGSALAAFAATLAVPSLLGLSWRGVALWAPDLTAGLGILGLSAAALALVGLTVLRKSPPETSTPSSVDPARARP